MRHENESERFVSNLCQKTFLSLWSHPNPVGKKGKELCDLLVICGNDILIASVKDIRVGEGEDSTHAWVRWQRKAIQASAKQIYGAERWLSSQNELRPQPNGIPIPLPDAPNRNVFRLALAFGGGGMVPLYYGDLGRGFVHVMDEEAFVKIISELDTVTDFFAYLKKKENYLSAVRLLSDGHEEDLLALYLSNQHSFPPLPADGGPDLLVLDDTLWAAYNSDPSVIGKRRADEPSYLWDSIIETFAKGGRDGRASLTSPLAQIEIALRVMAREDRYWRRVLSKALLEFVQDDSIGSRIAISAEQGVTYVFLKTHDDEDEQDQVVNLTARCYIARDKVRENPIVIGIAMGSFEPGQPLNLYCLNEPDWTEEKSRVAKKGSKEFDIFRKPIRQKRVEREYPDV